MEKRVLLAVVLSLATLYVWAKLFPPPKPLEAPPAPAATISAPQQAPERSAEPVVKKQAPPADAPAVEKAAPEQRTVVEDPGRYRAEVTSYGAGLTSYKLLSKKYYTTENRRLVMRPGAVEPQVEATRLDEPTDLVTSYRPALLTRFPRSGFTIPDIPAFSLIRDASEGNGRTLVYLYETADVQIKKTLFFPRESYQIGLEVEVKNLRMKEISHHFEIGLTGFQDPAQKPGGIFSARVPQNEVMWDLSGKMTHLGLEGLMEKVGAEKLRGDLRWIAIGQQYFILAAALQHGPSAGEKQGAVFAEKSGALFISAEYADRSLKPGESVTYKATAFCGPKLPELLDEVTIDGRDGGLATSIDYTLEVLARPLLWIMRQIEKVAHNWVVAIVLLTLLVKLVTLYPSHRSMKSMKKMAELQPEIAALKQKCGEDKQRFNTELMDLYKKRGVNPMGGCLPMLIQMPIWFALYSMLNNAVELYRVRFLWIPDLTAADPYFVLPLLTGGLMYLQTKMSPAPADPNSKMMTTMMPIMFTAFSIFLPAGLTIYIMTNTVLGMAQQAIMSPNKKPAAESSRKSS